MSTYENHAVRQCLLEILGPVSFPPRQSYNLGLEIRVNIKYHSAPIFRGPFARIRTFINFFHQK